MFSSFRGVRENNCILDEKNRLSIVKQYAFDYFSYIFDDDYCYQVSLDNQLGNDELVFLLLKFEINLVYFTILFNFAYNNKTR